MDKLKEKYFEKVKKLILSASEIKYKHLVGKKVLFLFLNFWEKKFVKSYFENTPKSKIFENNLKEYLKKNEFVIYGAGGGGFLFVEFFCKRYNLFPKFLIDKDPSKSKVKEFKVVSFEKFKELIDKDFSVILAISNREIQEEIKRNLKTLGIKNVICLPSYFWGSLILKEQNDGFRIWRNYLKSLTFYKKNLGKMLKAFDCFLDRESLEVYYKLLKSLILLKSFKLPSYSSSAQYFPKEINFSKGYKVFIDCGAYTGDSVKQLVSQIGKIERLICFEPERENYYKLINLLKDDSFKIAEDIIALPCGVYDKNKVLKFKKLGSGSKISDEGDENVMVVKLDDVLCGLKPTFIKMDIEGAELEALKGAKRIIKEHKPDLAICVYHKPEHLWEIPLYLKKLVPEYKLYLRKYGEQFVTETVLYATV